MDWIGFNCCHIPAIIQAVSVITLTTDFGTRDWFAGTMKGVILKINARAHIVDLTHGISSGDILSGAFALASSYGFFPKGTIHVAVVDPGVGGPRRAIAVRTQHFTFIGPDNGVLSLALASETVKSVRLLENPNILAETISQTFHGRDIFAPAAAHLSKGVRFRSVGTRAGSYVQVNWPEPKVEGGCVEGEIVYFDQFGNAITNIPGDLLPSEPALEVHLQAARLCGVEKFYSAVPIGSPAAVLGSTGLLEIIINGGSATQTLGLEIGDRVRILRKRMQRAG